MTSTAPLEALLTALLVRVRRDFYSGAQAKYWFAQQQMAKKALLHPATWLHRRGVQIPAARYEAILTNILDTAHRHGDLAKLKYVSRYLLHCVQQHMEHHGDEYYREGVAIRNRVSLAMTALERAHRGADSTVPILAEADKLLQIGKRKGKKQTADNAFDLFSQPKKAANSN
jgi:hypothetical protein